MIRLLFYILVVFALTFGVAWVADRPGAVTIDWLGWQVDVPILTALLALAAIVVAAIVLLALIGAVLRAPRSIGLAVSRRRRERGRVALSRGLVAVGAGDLKLARRYAGEARRAIPTDPAARLLEAQTAQLAGDRAGARAAFEAMLDDPDTRVLGLHGLYVEAQRNGDTAAAARYADEAARHAPALPWAGRARFEHAAQRADWESAIAILDRNAHNGLVDKATARRQKAVLLTARAREIVAAEPDRARHLAVEAHGLAEDLVPAAATAASLLIRNGDQKKAGRILETTWRRNPHPEIAALYADLRPGDTARDRLKRVRILAAMRPGEIESKLAVAAAAIDAREFDAARAELREVVALNPTRRACLMMAELEDTEHGDRGRVREWLSRAVAAPADATWTADGTTSETWAPVSPVSGQIDAYAWKVPVAALDAPGTPILDEALFAPPVPREPPPMIDPPAPVASAPASPPAPTPPARTEPAPPAAGSDAAVAAASVATPAPAPAAAPDVSASAPGPETEPATPKPVEFPLRRAPDDPGPEDGEPEALRRAI